ncbi:DUF732 domain-containing protein [Mycobacterium sp. SM1]|uniref:DUF732 domain-containing protein n=1 Tax=Mycobacterium sp. SM1 TaxID=2816243 RepID=UPI001BCD356B|nr:DUF732 domain-containing protein [Mycobacterium sp. SM1]MBS4727038.1 DUF732 domain-containing protein [Mycobacterium sp. SM1]
MRDRDTIDAELRRLAALRRSIRAHGGTPSIRQIDELLDERLGHRAELPETGAIQPWGNAVVARARPRRDETGDVTPAGHKAVLRRFGPLAVLPLSLVAAATVLVVMLTVHNPHPAVRPTPVPPSDARPLPPPGPPTAAPPASSPAASSAPAAPLGIVDKAFIDALTQQGVPVPSHEYVIIHGHAVCDFLAHQPDFTEAVRFVQRSSIWDAGQSAEFAAGAVVSYCPQYEPASPDNTTRQAFQNALSDLQAIQNDLQGIQDDLHALPGQG